MLQFGELLARPVINVRNETGGTLAVGDLVYLSGWNETHKRFLVSKADADVAGAQATFIVSAAILTAANGQVVKKLRLTGCNTNGATVGDPVYLSTTAGGWTLSAPSGADDINQIIGRVTVVHASTGEIEVDVESLALAKIGSNEMQAGAIVSAAITDGTIVAADLATDSVEAAEIAAGAVDTAELAAGAVFFADAKVFVSTEQTGTGSSQNVAHGLGGAPTAVVIAVTELPDAAAELGYDVAEGAHDATNVVATVTNTVKFKVFAWR